MIGVLLICTILLIAIFGGYGWTKLAYWDWLAERDASD